MRRLPFLAAAAAIASAVAVSPATAVDEKKPDVACFGTFFKDKAGDTARGNPSPAAQGQPAGDNLDLTEGFFKYDAAKDENTVNIRVKDLNKEVPQGATSVQWQFEYTGKDGVTAFVRAHTDFSGLVTYDYGGQEDGGVTTVNVRQGGTTGAFFEGPDGIVQIVLPKEKEPKGTTLKGFTIYGYETVQVIPGAAPTPIKGGQLYPADTASGGKATFTTGAACPAAPPAAPAPADAPPSAGPPAQSAEGPLPVKVLTKSAKRGKKVALKLKSSEPLTKLAAQLVKGKK
ncbi:MAG: hypothetical protein ACLGI3_18865, partial [Actinomycetes bacterium]